MFKFLSLNLKKFIKVSVNEMSRYFFIGSRGLCKKIALLEPKNQDFVHVLHDFKAFKGLYKKMISQYPEKLKKRYLEDIFFCIDPPVLVKASFLDDISDFEGSFGRDNGRF